MCPQEETWPCRIKAAAVHNYNEEGHKHPPIRIDKEFRYCVESRCPAHVVCMACRRALHDFRDGKDTSSLEIRTLGLNSQGNYKETQQLHTLLLLVLRKTAAVGMLPALVGP